MRKFIHIFPILTLLAAMGMFNTGCTAKVKESYHLRRAEKYYDSGEYDQAEIEYKNVLRKNHENGEAWSRLGLIYFDQGRFLQAASVLTHAQQLATNDTEVRLKLGFIYLGAGRTKDARNEAIFILGLDPKNRQAPVLLAQTVSTPNEIPEVRSRLQKLSAKGDPAAIEVALGTLALHENDLTSAEADFKKALSVDPKSSDADWGLGDLYLDKNDLKQADQAYKAAADMSPPRSGKKLQYAQFKIATGDVKDGQQIIEDLVKVVPDYLPACVELARITATGKKYDDAEAMLTRVLSRDPQNYDALLLGVQLEMDQNKPTEALVELGRMQKIYPQDPRIYYQMALAHVANKDFDKATASLNQALKLDPRFAGAIILRAQIQMKGGDTTTAVADLKQLIRQQPQVIEARLVLADAYRLQGNFQGAIQIYQDLETANPKDPQVYLLTGSALFDQKDYARARPEFEKALALQPDYLPAVEQMMNLDLTEKKFDAAQQLVEQQIKGNPKSGALQLLLAKVSAVRGDTTHEGAALSKAIELQPDLPGAYELLAEFYAGYHQDKKALAELQQGLAVDPKNISMLMFMGMVYNNEKNYDEAAGAYQKLLATEPNYTLALNNLACLDSEQLGQLDEAYELAVRARNLQPGDPAIADTLGWILYKKKDYSSALGLLQESAVQLTGEPEVQFHLGMTRYMMGNEAEARAAFQRALQLTKNFPDRDECNQCLAVLAVDPKTASADERASLEKRVEDQPDDLIALLRLAAIYQRDGEVEKAAVSYEAVLKADPQNVGAMINLAHFYAASDPAKAFEFARNAYKFAPEDPNVLLILGRLAYQTGDDNWAYTSLLPSVQNNTASPDTLYEFGMAAYDLGRLSEATSAIQNALAANPSFLHAAQARQFLDLQALAGNPAKEVSEEPQVLKILKSEPDNAPALVIEAAIDEQKSNFAAAEQLYEKVLGRHPNFAPAQRQLAMLYSEDPAKDQQTYDLAVKARQAFPDDPGVARALGIVVYRMAAGSDDYNRAAGLLAESARGQTPDAELMYYLGMTQYHLKQQAQCKASLQSALALHLSGKPAEEAKGILAGLKK